MGALVLLFFLTLLIGIPVSFGLGLSSLTYILKNGMDTIIIPQRMFAGSDSFTLMAIPLFVFSGEIMNRCGVTKRIMNFAQALLGFIPGGLFHVNVFASMLMAGISGSTTADVASEGSMIIPSMEQAGYDRAYATAITAASATIGSIIPPSILMVLYGSITGISIGQLFISGIVPGVIIGVSQMIYGYFRAKKNPEKYDGTPIEFSWNNLWHSFLEAIPALIMPMIIIGGILTGVFTATEAGAISSAYGLLVGIFIYKEFTSKDIVPTILSSAKTTGASMMIVASAMAFSWILAKEGFPSYIASILSSFSNGYVIYTMMILIMVIIGCFMDTTAAAIIMVPIFAPIAASLGLDPVHFGLVMVLTFVFGGITPPVGVTIYVASSVGKVKMEDLLGEMWAFIIMFFAVIMLVAFFPEISMTLPRLLK